VQLISSKQDNYLTTCTTDFITTKFFSNSQGLQGAQKWESAKEEHGPNYTSL